MPELKAEDDPFKSSIPYDVMAEQWVLPMTLMGGTRAMQRAGHTFLPQEDAESDKTYENRRARTFLFNGFRRAVVNLVGRVFSKAIQLKDNISELEYLEEDCDRQGHHLNVFARDVFKDGVIKGKSHILVEMPKALPRGSTYADEKAQKQQPYFVHITAEQVIGWRYEIRGGQNVLVQLRFTEEVTVPTGAYGTKCVKRVRVLEEKKWTLYEKNDRGEPVVVDEGVNTLGKIPLVTFYTNYKFPMVAEPPLEDLAFMNLAHWQSGSDQRQIVHFARVPILFGAGIERSNSQEPQAQKIAPDTMLRGPLGATLTFVEHSGQAIGAGQKDLEALEDKMAVMGMEPMASRSGNPTATGKVIDTVEVTSLLQQWAIGLGDAFEQAFGLAAEWLDKDAEDAPSVAVNTDLSYSLRDSTDIQTLLQMRLNDEITRETFLQEMKRRGVLSDALDVEEEMEKLELEGPDVPPVEPPPGTPPPNPNASLGGAA